MAGLPGGWRAQAKWTAVTADKGTTREKHGGPWGEHSWRFFLVAQTVCSYGGNCSLLIWSPYLTVERLSSSKRWANAMFYKELGLTHGFDGGLIRQWAYFLWGRAHQWAFSLRRYLDSAGVAQMGAVLTMCKSRKICTHKSKDDGRSFCTEMVWRVFCKQVSS